MPRLKQKDNLAFLPKLWLEIADHSTLSEHKASQVIPAMAPRSIHHWKVETRCLSRGEFRLGPMALTSGDPFGLFLLQHHLSQPFYHKPSHIAIDDPG